MFSESFDFTLLSEKTVLSGKVFKKSFLGSFEQTNKSQKK